MKCPFGWPASRLSSSEGRSATKDVDVAEDLSVCSFPVLFKGMRMASEKSHCIARAKINIRPREDQKGR